MEIFALEVLRTFATKSVHGEAWPKDVYAVSQYVTDGNIFYFTARNLSSTFHAEDGVLNHLEYLLTSGKLQSQKIKLFLTYSPCHRCSQRILNFLDMARWHHNTILEVEVVFSAFYRVRRPSCERNPACRAASHFPSLDYHRVNVEGLRTLHRAQGIVLRTFNPRDWVDLRVALGVHMFDFGGRQEEDDLLRSDFQQIMGLTSTSKLTPHTSTHFNLIKMPFVHCVKYTHTPHVTLFMIHNQWLDSLPNA